jgi:hypothetical protein
MSKIPPQLCGLLRESLNSATEFSQVGIQVVGFSFQNASFHQLALKVLVS